MQYKLNQNESGRSMVEMLGVLAVIGVLSVGGIAGYRNAMDKRAANEIINAVNKRAVVASGQLLRSTSFSLSEFESDVLGYQIGVAVAGTDWTAMQNEFAIKVENIPQKICQKVVDMGWNLPTEIYIGGTTSKNCADGNNKLTFAFNNEFKAVNSVSRQLTCAGAKPKVGTNTVDTNTCVNGQWQCPNGQLECNGTCCGEKQLCISPGTNKGTCYTPSDETSECATNEDCTKNPDYGTGYFCLLSGESSTTTDTSGCTVATKGECKKVSDYKGGVGASGPFTGWTYSNAQMDWWAANNWCLAQGKFMVTLDDVHKATGTSGNTTNERTVRKNALIAMFGSARSIWTSTICGPNLCDVYRMNSAGNVSGLFARGRSNSNYYSACRG